MNASWVLNLTFGPVYLFSTEIWIRPLALKTAGRRSIPEQLNPVETPWPHHAHRATILLKYVWIPSSQHLPSLCWMPALKVQTVPDRNVEFRKIE